MLARRIASSLTSSRRGAASVVVRSLSASSSELEKPLKAADAKEELPAVPDMSIDGLGLAAVKEAVKNLLIGVPAPTEGKPKLGRWAVGCDAALKKKYT